MDAPIGRNPKDRKMMAVDRKNGKRAVTHYRVLENFDKYSFYRMSVRDRQNSSDKSTYGKYRTSDTWR